MPEPDLPPPPRIAYVDVVGGVAGDMLLAALIDAGAPVEALRAGLAGLGVEAFELAVSRKTAGALDACRVDVTPEPGPAPHRHLSDVLAILAGASLPARAHARAVRTFEALARAEARVHGTSVEEVHFHEVGALDAIVDVAGVCLALELLGVDRVEASSLPLGRGATTAAHGALPLPAPAVLRLVEEGGVPVEGRDVARELVTPTGAALLVALAERWGPYPSLRVERVGYGAGARTAGPGELPNLVRVVLGRPPAPAAAAPGQVVALEANLDDQPPEQTAYLVEALLGAGALDAWLTPVHMKKGRPGLVVTALSEPAAAGAVEDVLLRESTTLGVRRRREERSVLPREVVTVETVHGSVRVKLARRPDGTTTAAPEYEDCARLARERGVPLRAVYAAALAELPATGHP